MRAHLPFALLAAMTGCATPDRHVETDGTTPDTLAVAATLLPPGPLPDDVHVSAPGDHNADVKAVHDYLLRFGYFPNDHLAQDYPRWRPAVATASPDPTFFGNELKDAVFAFQRNFNLPQTGNADKATLSAMNWPRCGVPDNMPHASIIATDVIMNRLVRYGVEGYVMPMYVMWTHEPHRPHTNSDLHHTVYGAVVDHTDQMAWDLSAQMKTFWLYPVRFHEGAQPFRRSAPFMALRWHYQEDMGCGGGFNERGVLAHTQGCEIHFNDQYDWWIDDAPGTDGSVDFKTVVLHQLGHSVGLGHVTEPSAAMYPAYNLGRKRNLVSADRNALHSLYGDPEH